METFTPIEMATIYRQAMNKQGQIVVFAQTQLKEEAEIVRELVAAGVDKRTIPYKYRDFIPKDEKKPARKPAKKVNPDSIETRGMRDMEDAIIDKLDAQRAEADIETEKRLRVELFTEEIQADDEKMREETAQRLQRAIDDGLGQEHEDAADTGDSSSVFCEDRKKPSPSLTLSDKRTVPVSVVEIEKMVKDIQQTQVEVAELIAEREELLAGLRKIRAAIDYVHQMLHEGE